MGGSLNSWKYFFGPPIRFTHGELSVLLFIKTSPDSNLLVIFIVNMLKSKTFVKKTRSGGVMKIVREHYLRDDIWCGSESCTDCKQESAVLQRDACIESNLCSYPHYVMPDTNVVLHQVKKGPPSPLEYHVLLNGLPIFMRKTP